MPASNLFSSYQVTPQSPALGLVAITPSDSADLSTAVRSIYVGVGGDVCVIDTAGNTVTHVGAPQGGYLGPFAVARVKATGTTASSLIGYI
jgi:hypothetical protein